MVKSNNRKDLVNNYLHTLGLTAFQTNEEFWDHLEKRHDDSLLEKLDDAFIAKIDGENDENVYAIKNQNLKLSLDVANYSADFYRSYFNWFINQHQHSPKQILDIGCDNGIVTCFYALLYPNSQVFGIDIQENAIRCSRLLAKKIKLENITFLTCDVRQMNKLFSDHSFDLITSVRSFHEIIGGFPEIPEDISSQSLHKITLNSELNHLLLLIKAKLRDEESEFLTIERLDGQGAIRLWEKELENANLHIKRERSGSIEFHELGINQQMPILTLNRDGSDSS